MIKVIVKESKLNSDGHYETLLVEKEHKNGEKALVFNGVLTIFTKDAVDNNFTNAIAGYEPSCWTSWEKQ